MSSSILPEELGQALVNFSKHGAYPEEESTSAAVVEDSALSLALEVLQKAKDDLESEVKKISRESAADVDEWIEHITSIQDDISESKQLAQDIARMTTEDQEHMEALQEQEQYSLFLQKEIDFQNELLLALSDITRVNILMNEAESFLTKCFITEAISQLEAAGKELQKIPLDHETRPMRTLRSRGQEVRSLIHKSITDAWNLLVGFDAEERSVKIYKTLPTVNSDMGTVFTGLEKFNEMVPAAQRFCEDLKLLIIEPRIDLRRSTIPAILIDDHKLSLEGTAARTVQSVLADLHLIFSFLSHSLPTSFVQTVASILMPSLTQCLKESWLEIAVPATLDDQSEYEKTLACVSKFAEDLDVLDWQGSEPYHQWVETAPRIWLSKRRETALDWTRNQISMGVGDPREVERAEKQTIGRQEAKDFGAVNNGSAANQDWDTAWGSDEETEEAVLKETGQNERNRRSFDEEHNASTVTLPNHLLEAEGKDEEVDDAADAWGWGDDDDEAVEPDTAESDTPAIPPAKTTPLQNSSSSTAQTSSPTCEVTLTEKYWISSIPQPILLTIKKLYEDGATLTGPGSEKFSIAAAAPGLFSLPILVLAMYRAISPSCYANHPGGKMFLYNDATWLAESLAAVSVEWKARKDLTPRAFGMVKLESDIKALISFGKRAYTKELTEQRIIVNDLFEGTQNFFQQDVEPGKYSLDGKILSVIQHVRSQAAIWKNILPYSAWASAAGSLVNAICARIISDVFDLPDISVDEAERIAVVISRVAEMDDMFLKSSVPGSRASDGPEVPLTSKFADQWFKMNYLSEFLQSNLKDILYLWVEGELSLYFTVDEVVDLMGLSFEKNSAVKGTIRQIRENPNPKG